MNTIQDTKPLRPIANLIVRDYYFGLQDYLLPKNKLLAK